MRNKVVCLHTAWFFSELLTWMYKNNSETAIDESGTLWHIEDVKNILATWKAA